MTDTVRYQVSGHVARLILDNPARHNSLGREELDAIQSALSEVSRNEDLRVLVFTGTGERTFCAGASLEQLGAGIIREYDFQHTAEMLHELSIPTICALNGSVYGGGVELALSCDFRLGVKGSRMKVPAASVGICYPFSGVSRLVEHLGVNLAKRMLIACEEFDAHAMLEIGFLDQLLGPEQLQGAVSELAERISGMAPLAVQSMKEILVQVVSNSVDTQRIQILTDRCASSADLQEGLRAHREKRPPRFSGE